MKKSVVGAVSNLPHRHKQHYNSWTNGAEIEVSSGVGDWTFVIDPSWSQYLDYRIKQNDKPMNNTAPEFLQRAKEIMEERGKQYDKPGGERSMGKTVAAFNAITGRDLTEQEGWEFMVVLKSVRFFSNTEVPHRDSLEDGIAYQALMAECAMKGEKK